MKRTKNVLFYLVLIVVSSYLIACNRVRNSSSGNIAADTSDAANNSATTPNTTITPNTARTPGKFDTIPDTVNIPSGYPIDPPVDLEFPNMPPIAPGNQNIPGVSPNISDRAIVPGRAVPNQTSILPRMPTTPSQAYTTPNNQIIPRLPSSNINRASVPSRAIIPSQPSPPVSPGTPSQSSTNVARTPISSATTVPPRTSIPPVIPTTPSRAFTPPSRTIPSRQAYTTPKTPAARVQPKRASTTAKSTSSQEVQYSQQSISDANAVVRGLVVARREGKIKPYTRTWRQTQDAIILLRRGKTRQEAATKAKVPMSLLTQLIEQGNNQPTIASSLLASEVKPPEDTSIVTKSSPIQEVNYSQQSISDANAVVRGLVVARREGKIKPYTRTWRQTQDAIILLRRGKTRQEAATKAKVPMSLLTQLIEWGQNQPNIGSVMNLQNSQPLSEQVR
ncbi:ABC transporter ATP-binding protein [Chlorogloeopsis sp. ULAP01]|uniref:ABC transporter ATP-binding protein n=1 Tax=Chlorogloeopsis sp. ULAP01 TaxID=3056483 RepID=UPI0025AA80EB|nr:ABC transporter ATP-binding protein [Chlorogloeopsis sp. ULAP01]MDM9379117.1 ABC transporter ATP-binding protein [Chlorogloeopsis sp. ULAP01]